MAEKKPDAALTMVSVVQFAALVELTVQRVYQLCQQNILPRIVDGNLPVIAGMQAYIRYLRGFSNADAQSRTSFAQERARLFKARADIAELERQTRFDRLVPIEDIEASWVQLVGNFRTRIIAIPSKAATRVVGVKTPAQGLAILTEVVNEALLEISTAKLELVKVRGPWEASDVDREIDADDDPAADDDDLDVGGRASLPKPRGKRGPRKVVNAAR